MSKKNKSKLFKMLERLAIIVIVVFVTAAIVKATDKKMSGNIEGEGECPKNMVLVPFSEGDFCIDIYEVSAGEECYYENPSSKRESLLNIDNPDCKPVSDKGKLPWRYISQNHAKAACAKAGKRLPTNKEWLQAAYGTPDLKLEWGGSDCHLDSNWEEQPGRTASGESCKSSIGAYDMIGNVWEWVDGTVTDGEFMGKKLPEKGYIIAIDDNAMPLDTQKKASEEYFNDYFWIKTKGVRSISRGGAWSNKGDAGQYAVYAVSEVSSASSGVGFRCVK